METMPSQVMNHYSQKNQEAHRERALAFKKAANLHCPSNVCLRIVCICASYCGWLISPISSTNQNNKTNQEIGEDDPEDTRVSTLSADIKEADLDHQQKVLHLGQARQDNSLSIRRVPLPTKWCRADTVLAQLPLPISRNQLAAMAPPLLKHQKSLLLNKLSESDCALSTQALVSPNKSIGDQNIPQPKASCDQNVPQHQKPTCKVANRFMEAIIFRKTPWPILSNDKYSMVEEAWKLAIEAKDHKWALAGAPVGTPSVCQLPGGPSLKIDPQKPESVSFEFD